MRILVDGDACPVKDIIEEVAKEENIEVIMYFDDAHEFESEYSEVIIVPRGSDSVDYKIIADSKRDDIVITNDYGLASLVLPKNLRAVSPSGQEFTEINIDSFLFTRAMGQKMRKSGKRTKGPKKRKDLDNIKFKAKLLLIIKDLKS